MSDERCCEEWPHNGACFDPDPEFDFRDWPDGYPCGLCQMELNACSRQHDEHGFWCCDACLHRKKP